MGRLVHTHCNTKISSYHILLEFIILFYFICTGVVPAFISGQHMHARVFRDQRTGSDVLELELLMVVNHCVRAGNRTQVLCEGSHCS